MQTWYNAAALSVSPNHVAMPTGRVGLKADAFPMERAPFWAGLKAGRLADAAGAGLVAEASSSVASVSIKALAEASAGGGGARENKPPALS